MIDIRVSNFLRKELKNNLQFYFFLKNSLFAMCKPRAKRIFGHALNQESLAISAQPLHLKLTWSTKLAKAELSPFQFDLNWAKRWPSREAHCIHWLSVTRCG